MGNKNSSQAYSHSIEATSLKDLPEYSTDNYGAGLAGFSWTSNKVRSDADEAAMEVDPSQWEYPFENLVLEGGGNKGMAFVGTVQYLEEQGILSKIKRFSGASAGGMAATFLALGYTAEEMKELMYADLKSLFIDHKFGIWSLVPNLMNKFGWNPAKEYYNWIADKIKAKSATGNPNMTFNDLYKERGVELCLVVSNLNQSRAQLCHPKTRPDMPILEAVRMTMSIPLFFQAWTYNQPGSADTDTYIDGGVLNNYPINCFDGWALSMETENSYVHRLRPLNDLNKILQDQFKGSNPKTFGCLLFDETERDVMRFDLEKRIGVDEPKEPESLTQTWKKKHLQKVNYLAQIKETQDRMDAIDAFMCALDKNKTGEVGQIDMKELQAALKDLTKEQAEILFGEDADAASIMKLFDLNEDCHISTQEALYQLEKSGIEIRESIYGFGRREVGSFPDFVSAMSDATSLGLKYLYLNSEDVKRTVGINTGHVGTMDFDLDEKDKEFVTKRGYNATEAFFKYFVVENPDLVKRKVATK